MEPFTWRAFINHLSQCQGCTGKRTIERCRFFLHCETAEALSKKGLIEDSEELMRYGINRSKCGDLSEECDRASEARYAGVGPCSDEQV